MSVQAVDGSKPGYIHSAPFDAAFLKVDAIHSIHYEQYGLKTGLPVVFLHGGPGGHTTLASTAFFDPSKYRVVLFDQRGSGKSLPNNELRDNTTQHLISDIEKLREHLQIQQWHMVFGGSWGSTLSLAYGQKHPDRLRSLVLRGVTTVRRSELAHSRQGPHGAAKFYPDYYERFLGFLSVEERQNPIAAYYKKLTSGDSAVMAAAAREWIRWDLTMVAAPKGAAAYEKLDDAERCYTHALMEAHFFVRGAWLDEGQLLSNMEKIQHIPGAIIQGRSDMITPPATAWELHKAWPKSTLHWIDNAGHSATEPGTFAKLIEVCDAFVNLP